MGKKSAPKPPDPAATAQAQAEANRITQFTPQGNLIFGNLDESGQFAPSVGGNQAASMIEETPFQEQFRGIGEGAATNLAQSLAPNAGNLQQVNLQGLPQRTTGLDLSQVPGLPNPQDFSQDAGRVEQATFERMANLLNPQFDLQQRRLEGQLADQGLPMGGEAYGGELSRFGDVRNRALQDAALQAVNAGRSEQQRLFGNTLATRGAGISDQLTNAQLAEQARSGGLAEQSGVRAQQLQELASLLGGQQYNPSGAAAFTPPGQIDIVGPTNMAYQGQLANWQNQQQQQAGLLNGLFGLGSLFI